MQDLVKRIREISAELQELERQVPFGDAGMHFADAITELARATIALEQQDVPNPVG